MKFLKRLKTKKALTIVEVLVSIVLTSIILLSMTKVVVLVLRNANESETYDQGILQFSSAEEKFKSWYFLPATGSAFLKDFCALTPGTYVDITQDFNNAALVPKLTVSNATTVPPSPILYKPVTTPNLNMLISLKIISNQNKIIQGDSNVHWEISGKKYDFTNSIYIYTAQRCI